MKTKTGLLVDVLRGSHGDCTLGGPSSTFNEFVVLDDRVSGPFEPSDRAPAMILVRREIAGRPYIHAVPESMAGKQVAFGGNFIWTSDSRLREVCQYPIPIHDRDMAKERR